jgi:hypothetical protein
VEKISNLHMKIVITQRPNLMNQMKYQSTRKKSLIKTIKMKSKSQKPGKEIMMSMTMNLKILKKKNQRR